jgi:hypothetical protein
MALDHLVALLVGHVGNSTSLAGTPCAAKRASNAAMRSRWSPAVSLPAQTVTPL